MKSPVKIFMVLVLGGLLFLAADYYRFEYMYDKADLAKRYYTEVFLGSVSRETLEDRNIDCDENLTKFDENYTVESRSKVTYSCSNGRLVIFAFDKGAAGHRMLIDWIPDHGRKVHIL